MQLNLDGIIHTAGEFTFQADAVFHEGVHLITGPVGSGKTTCAGIISRVIPPGEGKVRYDGIRTSALLMQFPEYHLTTPEVGAEAASWGGDREKILAVAGLAGRGGEDPLNLSRGELRRLHLAAVLTGTHDLVVLDEPYAGIDADARTWISSLIGGFRAGIVILITHDLTCLPFVSCIWEIKEGTLHRVGAGADAIAAWETAPPLIRYLIRNGAVPKGVSRSELEEAVCRIHG